MTDYHRGYSKGYSAGVKRGYRFVDRILRASKALRVRAERAEALLGLGLCHQCKNWERDGSCAWGYCRVKRAADTETPWFEPADPQRGRIVTQENFGCVLFSDKST